MSNYAIIKSADLPSMDFDALKNATIYTVRRCVDGTLALVEWDGDEPQCVSGCAGLVGVYSHSEIVEIMESAVWTEPGDIA